MDMSFSCPKCGLHITADESVVGELIDCPDCGHGIRVPPPKKSKTNPAAKSTRSVAGVTGKSTKSASQALGHKPLTVPHHHGPQESLLKHSHGPAAAKDEGPKIRVRCIKRSACEEVGHDHFDEVVTDFLNKVGQANIIHLSAISYGVMDPTGHMLPDYGIMIIYKG